ncbi:hypothetical protein PCE1_002913 [Barthelona sp. PCE]
MRHIACKGADRPINRVTYNHDGDLVFAVSTDKVATVWNSFDGKHLGFFAGHTGSITYCDVSIDSKLFLTCSFDGSAILWNVETGKQLLKFNSKDFFKFCAFNHDNTKFILVTKAKRGDTSLAEKTNYNNSLMASVYVFNVPDGIREHEGECIVREDCDHEFRVPECTALSLDMNEDRFAFGTTRGSVIFFDIEGTHRAECSPHHSAITSLVLEPNGNFFISASTEKKMKIFTSNNDHTVIKEWDAGIIVNGIGYFPELQVVACAGGEEASKVTQSSAEGAEQFATRLFHAPTGIMIGMVPGSFGNVIDFAVSPNGTSFLVGGHDGYLRIFHIDQQFVRAIQKGLEPFEPEFVTAAREAKENAANKEEAQ